jgi:hypothetical protein
MSTMAIVVVVSTLLFVHRVSHSQDIYLYLYVKELLHDFNVVITPMMLNRLPLRDPVIE